MSRLESSGHYALGVPVYLALMLLEWGLYRRRHPGLYGFSDTLSNFAGGLGEVCVGLLLGPWLLWLYDFGYARLALVRWAEGSPWPWILAVPGADLCYYLYHRAGHTVALLHAVHGVHHQSERFNLSVALRHPWFSDVYSFVFYIPMPVLGIPPGPFFFGVAVISFYALTVHTRGFNRPGFGFLVTPRTHIVHHARNPRYLGKNLGAMFTVWDRLFGTHVEVTDDDPPEIGSPAGYRSHDGALAQFTLFADLWSGLRASRTPREWARVLFGRPGWRPPGSPRRPRSVARSDASIPGPTKLYVAFQFPLLLAFGLAVAWERERFDLRGHLVTVLVVAAGLASLGGLLDGRRHAVRAEVARLACSAALLVLVR